jgi:hypothetical protein
LKCGSGLEGASLLTENSATHNQSASAGSQKSFPDFSNEYARIKIEGLEESVTIVPVILATSKVDPKNGFPSMVMSGNLLKIE